MDIEALAREIGFDDVANRSRRTASQSARRANARVSITHSKTGACVLSE